MPPELSTVRKALMWWFHWPGNPYVSVSAAVDFSAALAYLERINAGGGEAVSINHLVLAAVTRTLHDFPEANAWLVGRRILRQEHVGVAMPVLLEGHEAGAHQEVGLTVVQRADTLSLRGLAHAGRREVGAERRGKTSNPLIRTVSGLADRLPSSVLGRGLDLLDRTVRRHPRAALALQRQLGFTTVVTNAGAPFGRMSGALVRGGAFELPQRLLYVGTVWGLTPLQDEVLAVDGEPRVRPTLPLVLVFDHRLFDGVKAGRILMRFVEVLQDPAAVLGEAGDRVIGAAAG